MSRSSPPSSPATPAQTRQTRRARLAAPFAVLITVHRWLGIGVGLLMATWCVSGVVMMYVGYPELSEADRRAGLAPIDAAGCCTLPAPLAAGDATLQGARVEMLAGRPVLRWRDNAGALRVDDLREGGPAGATDADGARAVAAEHAARAGIDGTPVEAVTLTRNQWTVSGEFNAHRPLHRVRLDDPGRTELYVSSRTGEVVQDTTGRERFWNWPGAVTHWLYFASLRQHGRTWSQTVIWTSVLGCFLTVTGVVIGVRQLLLARATRRISPYRGINFIHHVSGLVFGLLVLAWVASGLASMNPWGLFVGEGAGAEDARLTGGPLAAGDVRAALAALPGRAWETPAVTIDLGRFQGDAYAIARTSDGAAARLDARTLAPAPLSLETLSAAAETLRPDAAIREARLLETEDAYYFGHHGEVELPVYRVIVEDDEATRYYLDPVSGALLGKLDADARAYRWLHQGLHRWDFAPGLRARPLWDVVVIALMAGVAAACLTGAYMGVRHLVRRKRVTPP